MGCDVGDTFLNTESDLAHTDIRGYNTDVYGRMHRVRSGREQCLSVRHICHTFFLLCHTPGNVATLENKKKNNAGKTKITKCRVFKTCIGKVSLKKRIFKDIVLIVKPKAYLGSC